MQKFDYLEEYKKISCNIEKSLVKFYNQYLNYTFDYLSNYKVKKLFGVIEYNYENFLSETSDIFQLDKSNHLLIITYVKHKLGAIENYTTISKEIVELAKKQYPKKTDFHHIFILLSYYPTDMITISEHHSMYLYSTVFLEKKCIKDIHTLTTKNYQRFFGEDILKMIFFLVYEKVTYPYNAHLYYLSCNVGKPYLYLAKYIHNIYSYILLKLDITEYN